MEMFVESSTRIFKYVHVSYQLPSERHDFGTYLAILILYIFGGFNMEHTWRFYCGTYLAVLMGYKLGGFIVVHTWRFWVHIPPTALHIH